MTGNDEKEKEEFKQRLVQEFELKELGRLKHVLGIEIACSNQGIFISLQKYVTDLLAETRKIGCRVVSTPMDPNHKLCKAEGESTLDKKLYQKTRWKINIFGSHAQTLLIQ